MLKSNIGNYAGIFVKTPSCMQFWLVSGHLTHAQSLSNDLVCIWCKLKRVSDIVHAWMHHACIPELVYSEQKAYQNDIMQ